MKAARDYVQKLMNHADTWAERIPKAFEQAHYDLHAVALANEASEGDAAVRAAKEAFAECRYCISCKAFGHMLSMGQTGSARVKELNKTAKEQLEQAKAELGRHNPEVQAEYERRRAEEGVRPITELEEALAEVEAKLSGLTPVNEAIIEAYERRSKVVSCFSRIRKPTSPFLISIHYRSKDCEHRLSRRSRKSAPCMTSLKKQGYFLSIDLLHNLLHLTQILVMATAQMGTKTQCTGRPDQHEVCKGL